MDGWDGWFENFDWQQYIEGQGSTDTSWNIYDLDTMSTILELKVNDP